MKRTKTGLAIAAVAAMGGVVAGGAVIAQAADSTDAAAAATSGPIAGYLRDAADGGRGAAPHEHTKVSGDELAKVKDAVTEENSGVTVGSVLQDPDGSYDVFGTKSGEQVMLEVSADLKTVTEHTGGPHGDGGPGGHGSEDTPVTGAELTRVTKAVEADDSAVTVQSVRKDPDGSYDVFGTKSGEQVMLEVSADLKTITENTVGPHRLPGDFGDRTDTPSTGTESSSDTVTS